MQLYIVYLPRATYYCMKCLLAFNILTNNAKVMFHYSSWCSVATRKKRQVQGVFFFLSSHHILISERSGFIPRFFACCKQNWPELSFHLFLLAARINVKTEVLAYENFSNLHVIRITRESIFRGNLECNKSIYCRKTKKKTKRKKKKKTAYVCSFLRWAHVSFALQRK